MPGSAPRADVWVVVEHPAGWGDAPLARAEHGVRVLMARRAVDRTASDGYRVWVAYCADRPATLRVGTLRDPAPIADWDLAELAAGSRRSWGSPEPDPLLLVCANGRRDRCCGRDGARLADRLWAGPDADRVLTCTHLGGHRFAPTTLLLPAGVLLGRLGERSATQVLPDARAGRLGSAHLRGFSTLPEPAQVAEVAVRSATGHDGMRPLAVDVTVTSPDSARAVVLVPPADRRDSPPDSIVEVDLVRASLRTVPSCGSAEEDMPRWVVSSAADSAPSPLQAPDRS